MTGSADNLNSPASDVPFRFTLRSLLVFVTIACALSGGITAAVRSVNEAHRLQSCRLTLHNISKALSSYHDNYGCFPPACVVDSAGTPMHSWRALITPFMSGQFFYSEYNFSEPWNSPHNLALANASTGRICFSCPTDREERGQTSYMMIVGSRMDSLVDGSMSRPNITYGSDTIIVAEVADSGVFWTEPRDLSFKEMSVGINDKSKPNISSHHVREALVLFADGRIEVLDQMTSEE